MNERPRIPTNLMTGFLGVGKTSAIRHLIRQKPNEERWSVLVNEFGEIGIDGAIIESVGGSRLSVTEIAGGCFCCSSDAPIDSMLMELIEQTRPQRLLIEPTGLGHPAKILDTLRGPRFRRLLDLQATICIADASDFANPGVTNVDVFQDQLHMADVVVVNKLDRTPPAQLAPFLSHLSQLFPPKSQILTTTQGMIDLSLLSTEIAPERVPLFPNAHPIAQIGCPLRPPGLQSATVSLLLPGHPLRKASPQQGRAACGWIFSPLDRFRKEPLLQLLNGSFDVRRLKGVFHVGNEWLLVNRVGGELTCERISYRRDSRLEVILDQSDFDWDDFEQVLIGCLGVDSQSLG